MTVCKAVTWLGSFIFLEYAVAYLFGGRKQTLSYVTFEFFTAVGMMLFFRVLTQCGFAGRRQRFGENSPHLQG
jgi:hypothetical protein